MALPAATGAAAFFAVTLMVGRGRSSSVPVPGVIAVTALSVVVAAAAAAVVAWAVRRSRRTKRASAQQGEVVAADRCRCWERDWFSGAAWRSYLAEHLREIAADPALGAVLRRCPTTDKTWLHLPACGLAVTVRLPGEPQPDHPTGAYL